MVLQAILFSFDEDSQVNGLSEWIVKMQEKKVLSSQNHQTWIRNELLTDGEQEGRELHSLPLSFFLLSAIFSLLRHTFKSKAM